MITPDRGAWRTLGTILTPSAVRGSVSSGSTNTTSNPSRPKAASRYWGRWRITSQCTQVGRYTTVRLPPAGTGLPLGRSATIALSQSEPGIDLMVRRIGSGSDVASRSSLLIRARIERPG